MTFTRSIHIEAPVHEVFDFWKDPHRQFSVLPGPARLVDVVTTEDGVGTFYSWRMTVAGLSVDGFDVVTEVVPDERIVVRSSRSVVGTWTYVFRPEGTGTRLTLRREPSGARVLRPADRLLDAVRGPLLRRVLPTLKAELEKAQEEAPGSAAGDAPPPAAEEATQPATASVPEPRAARKRTASPRTAAKRTAPAHDTSARSSD
ncbi:SRPBCC family protein [Geodermatophilus sp. SYSU D00684]